MPDGAVSTHAGTAASSETPSTSAGTTRLDQCLTTGKSGPSCSSVSEMSRDGTLPFPASPGCSGSRFFSTGSAGVITDLANAEAGAVLAKAGAEANVANAGVGAYLTAGDTSLVIGAEVETGTIVSAALGASGDIGAVLSTVLGTDMGVSTVLRTGRDVSAVLNAVLETSMDVGAALGTGVDGGADLRTRVSISTALVTGVGISVVLLLHLGGGFLRSGGVGELSDLLQTSSMVQQI